MRASMRHAWMLIILLAITGCSKFGTVEGQLVNALTGVPVVGVVVSIKGTTVESQTDNTGTFVLKQVVPGAQVLAVKGRIFAPSAPQVSISAGATVKLSAARVLPAPDEPGLYSHSSERITAISRIPSKQLDLGYGGVALIRNPGAASQKVSGRPLQLMFYMAGGEPAQSNTGIVSLQYEVNPWKAKGFANSEDYYQVQHTITTGLKFEKIENGALLITGHLPPGRYCLVRKMSAWELGDYWCFHISD